MTDHKLSTLMNDVRAVLFDFDGPICSVFAGLPAPRVAADLITLLREMGINLSAAESAEEDPLEVLRFSARVDQKTVQIVEDALCDAELAAVKVADPTPGGIESIQACVEAGKVAAIVSNNSAGAASSFLAAYGVREHVSPVIGRAYAAPERMKPNPEPLLQALSKLGLQPREAVLIGDSATDVAASKAAGVPCIAFVNKPGKLTALSGADIMIDDMRHLAAVLRSAS